MRALLLCLGLLATVAAQNYDEVFKTDASAILEDKAKWKMLFNCLMNRGPCEEYQVIKDALPKLVATKCEECTPEQKEKFNKIMQQFAQKYPEDYAELSKKMFPKPDE
ncbi:allergen Tha p 1-like [Leguminivora glycinivorella]|uniref:allergen Tha p 1-like n=1 Tax=Leguminivora glycinivorella TaxID=1035111 RepID=UPI00200D68FB|nr:allergen Tha p 1-like [Leguminivora glycinivorella]